MFEKFVYFPVLLIVTISLFISSCKSADSLLEENYPEHIINSYDYAEMADSQIKIVSYNIQRGYKIDEILETLLNSEKLQKPDVLLLQEVCGTSIDTISQYLSLNYVFYPIAKKTKESKDCGNAILTKHKIVSSKKLILPNEKIDHGRRSATIATVEINDTLTTIASVHMETIVMKLPKRIEQLEYILENINLDNSDKIIVGGDFNSFFNQDKERFNNLMSSEGFFNHTEGIDFTCKALGGLVRTKLDHIYTIGFAKVNSGVGPLNKASDHQAIWCTMQ